MLLPVSMAVELATARIIAFWLGTLLVRTGLEAMVSLAGFTTLILTGWPACSPTAQRLWRNEPGVTDSAEKGVIGLWRFKQHGQAVVVESTRLAVAHRRLSG